MVEKAPSIVIVAGEASGDLHGANLATELKRSLPSLRISGIGGRRMRESGVELLYDSSSWGAIGITEALKRVPRMLRVLYDVTTRLKADPPDLLILIDFGAFNVRLGRILHRAGVKVLYYFPPSSWHRGATYKQLDGMVDRVVTPFPWSAETLRRRGFRADFFGHPLLDVAKPSMSRDEFVRRFGFEASRPIVALLPGSRTQEIAHILPVMVVAAVRMLEAMPELQFAIPPAPSVNPFAFADELSKLPWAVVEAHHTLGDSAVSMGRVSPHRLSDQVKALMRAERIEKSPQVRIKLLPGMTYDVLAHSRAALLTSGTATVEAMILGCPMVAVYRGGRILTLEYRLFGKRIKFIAMPNIILDRMICPELVADAVTPSAIAELMLKVIADTPERAEMLEALAKARALLGEPGAVAKTAQVVVEMLAGK
jgi:lipid-A-disaccharide synthase